MNVIIDSKMMMCLFLQEIFEKMDWDKNGVVSAVEFKSYLSKLKKGEEMTGEEALQAFREIDTNGSKNIEWDEFLVRAFPDYH